MSSPEKFSLPLLLSFTPLSLCGATLSVADSVQVARQDTVSGAEVRLKSALVVGARQNRVENTAMGLSFLRPEQIRGIPTLMGEADLIKALQMQPGVSSGVEGFAGMMVRGGNDDQNLFLIDGNPIYQMNHLGGLFSAYNIGAVRDVAFYKGAFPARYGGRLSSVVDIATLSGDVERYRGNVTLGLTSANVDVARTPHHSSLCLGQSIFERRRRRKHSTLRLYGFKRTRESSCFAVGDFLADRLLGTG